MAENTHRDDLGDDGGDDTPSSDATECSSDKCTSLKQPVGVLMKEQDFFQEITHKRMNSNKIVT